MVSAVLLLLCVVLQSSLLGVYCTVEEGYSEWDYIDCVEQAGEREYTRRNYMPYREEVIEFDCIERALFLKAVAPNIGTVQRNWLNQLIFKTRADITNAGTSPVRIRKEYRMLSNSERISFNVAVNQLKSDTQRYDALSSLHVGDTALSAHRGPAFFTWHRVYLLLFENALREYDPPITLPYWDSTLDQVLPDPKTSILWGDTFFGNGNGIVTEGPFGGWTSQGRPLIRNYGESGRLMRPSDLDMTRDHLGEISFPNAELGDNLELHSYGVQLWVGGDMARLATATNDPIYFLLHAYTDCLWQKFRDNQTNPTTDWPWRYDGNPAHSINSFLRVMTNVQSKEVLSDNYGSLIYRCEEIPSCIVDANCSSPNLRCDQASNRCITRELGDQLVRETPCQGPIGYQNNYCLDGNICNEADWVYIPVEIIYNRPPDYEKYNARPLYSPTWVFNQDIYSPNRFNGAYRTLWNNRRQSNPVYRDCKCKGSDSGRAYVQSYGLNYTGSYRDYAPVDRRLAISSSTAYVAVKKPTDAPTRSLIRVYDDCGRICTPVCPPEYTNCSGVVSVSDSSGTDQGYGDTIEDAMYINFQWDSRSFLWKRLGNFALKFYCTFEGDWPFGGMSYIPDPTETRPTRPVDPDERDLTTKSTTIKTTTTTTTTTTTPTTTVLVEPNYCFNSSECYGRYEPTGCVPCIPESYSPCPGDYPGSFRQCGMGAVWEILKCYGNLVWDQEYSMCNWASWLAFRKSIRRLMKGP